MLGSDTFAEQTVDFLFKMFDRDSDGFVTKDEFLIYLRSTGIGNDMTDQEAFDFVDSNKDGKITKEEWLAVLKKKGLSEKTSRSKKQLYVCTLNDLQAGKAVLSGDFAGKAKAVVDAIFEKCRAESEYVLKADLEGYIASQFPKIDRVELIDMLENAGDELLSKQEVEAVVILFRLYL